MVNRVLPFADELTSRRTRGGARWYHWVIIALIAFHLIQVQHDRLAVRKELDDNAKLIKALQDKRVVDELAERKKGGK